MKQRTACWRCMKPEGLVIYCARTIANNHIIPHNCFSLLIEKLIDTSQKIIVTSR